MPKPNASFQLRSHVSPLALLAAGVTVLAVVPPEVALAGPQGATVRGGDASISQTGNTTNVQQSTGRVIIEWQSFDTDVNETVNFAQPDASSIALNRVTGGDHTNFKGALEANGNVWVVNENGVTFHQSAQIDVGGLLATTSDIDNTDFMNGNFDFREPGNPDAKVINEGNITFGEAGLAALVAPQVENRGVIVGEVGTVVLNGAESFAVDLAGDGLFAFEVSESAISSTSTSASNTGEIRNNGGRVLISAESAVGLLDQTVSLGGLVQARSFEGHVGSVEIDGGDGVTHVTGVVDASGKAAGQKGGNVSIQSEAIALDEASVVDVSGDTGGGTALIGGTAVHGGDGDRAEFLNVAVGAQLLGNTTGAHGDGGTFILWSDNTTRFDGSLEANGGSSSGDGGFAEISGAQNLGFTGMVDLLATNGEIGQLLLDPEDIIIQENNDNSQDSLDDDILEFGERGNSTIRINASALEGAGAGITLQATDDITVNQEITTDRDLTFQAGDDITINENITSSADLTFQAQDDVAVNAEIVTSAGLSLLASVDLTDVGGGAADSEGFLTFSSVAGGDSSDASLVGATVTLQSAGDIVLPAITADTLNVSVLDGSIFDGDGSLITVSGVAAFSAGDPDDTGLSNILLDNDTNQFVTVSLAGVNATVVTAGALVLGATDVSSLNVTAEGEITDLDGAPITVTGIASFVARDADTDDAFNITLDNGASTFGALAATGEVVTLTNDGALQLGAIDAATLSVTAGGEITDLGGNVILVDGLASFVATDADTGDAADITLDNVINRFNTVSAIGADVTLADADALVLGGITADTLDVRAGGEITDLDGETLAVTNRADFTATVGDTDTLTSVTLDNETNDFGTVSVDGSDVVIRDENALVLGGITASSLLVTAGGAITDIDADAGAGTPGEAIVVTGDAAADNSIIAQGLFDADPGDGVPGVVTEFDIELDNGLHSFDQVVGLTGDDVTFATEGAIALGEVTATNLTANSSAGSITDTAGRVIAVTGQTSLTAGVDGARENITLDNSEAGGGGTPSDLHQLNTVSVTGAAVTLVDADDLEITAASAASMNVETAGSTAVSGTVNTGTLDVTGDTGVSVASTGSIIATGAVDLIAGVDGVTPDADILIDGSVSGTALTADATGDVMTGGDSSISVTGLARLEAGGNVSLDGDLVAGTLVSTAENGSLNAEVGSDIVVTNAASLQGQGITRLLGKLSAGSLAVDAGLNLVTRAGTELTIQNNARLDATGIVTLSGMIGAGTFTSTAETGSLVATTGGDIIVDGNATLDSAIDVQLLGNLTAGSLTVDAETDITFAGDVNAGALRATAGDEILSTDTSTMTVSGLADFTAANRIQLDQSLDQDFLGRVDLAGTDVSVVDTGSRIRFGAVSADTLTVRALGDVFDTGGESITVDGATGIIARNLAGTTFDIELDNTEHDFSTVDLIGDSVSIGDANDLNVLDADTTGLALDAGGDLTLGTIATGQLDADAGGSILEGATSSISVTGSAAFSAGDDVLLAGPDGSRSFGGQLDLAGDVVEVDAATAITLGEVSAGSLELTALGAIGDTGSTPGVDELAVEVSGAATLTATDAGGAAQDIILDNQNNDLTTVTATGANVTLGDVDDVTLVNVSADDLTVDAGGTVGLGQIGVTNLDVTSGVDIVEFDNGADTAEITVANTTSLDAARDIRLRDHLDTHDFGTNLSLRGQEVLVDHLGAITLDNVNATTLNLRTNGEINDGGAGTVVVSGDATLVAQNAANDLFAITIDNAGTDFGSLSFLGTDVTVQDANALTITESRARTSATLGAGAGDLTLDVVTVTSPIGVLLGTSASGGVTANDIQADTVALGGTGTTALAATAAMGDISIERVASSTLRLNSQQEVRLSDSLVDGTLQITAPQQSFVGISFNDVDFIPTEGLDSLTLDRVTVDGDLKLTAGAISLGFVRIDNGGALDLTALDGNIATLPDAEIDFAGAVSDTITIQGARGASDVTIASEVFEDLLTVPGRTTLSAANGDVVLTRGIDPAALPGSGEFGLDFQGIVDITANSAVIEDINSLNLGRVRVTDDLTVRFNGEDAGGDLTQTGAGITVGNIASFASGSDNIANPDALTDITLETAINRFGSVEVVGGAVSLRDANGFAITEGQVTRGLTIGNGVDQAGDVSFSDLTVDGGLDFDVDGNVTLDRVVVENTGSSGPALNGFADGSIDATDLVVSGASTSLIAGQSLTLERFAIDDFSLEAGLALSVTDGVAGDGTGTANGTTLGNAGISIGNVAFGDARFVSGFGLTADTVAADLLSLQADQDIGLARTDVAGAFEANSTFGAVALLSAPLATDGNVTLNGTAGDGVGRASEVLVGDDRLVNDTPASPDRQVGAGTITSMIEVGGDATFDVATGVDLSQSTGAPTLRNEFDGTVSVTSTTGDVIVEADGALDVDIARVDAGSLTLRSNASGATGTGERDLTVDTATVSGTTTLIAGDGEIGTDIADTASLGNISAGLSGNVLVGDVSFIGDDVVINNTVGTTVTDSQAASGLTVTVDGASLAVRGTDVGGQASLTAGTTLDVADSNFGGSDFNATGLATVTDTDLGAVADITSDAATLTRVDAGDLGVTAASDVTVGTLNAADATISIADGDLSVTGATLTGGLTTDVNGDVNLATVDAAGASSLTVGGALKAEDFNSNGTMADVEGAISLTDVDLGDADLEAGQTLTGINVAADALTVTAGGVTIDTLVADSADLTTLDGDVLMTDATIADSLTIDANGITASGDATLTRATVGGASDLAADGSIDATALMTDSLTANAGDGIDIRGSDIGAGNLDAGGDIIVAAGSADSLSVAGDDLVIRDVAIGGPLDARVSGAVDLDNVTAGATDITAGGGVEAHNIRLGDAMILADGDVLIGVETLAFSTLGATTVTSNAGDVVLNELDIEGDLSVSAGANADLTRVTVSGTSSVGAAGQVTGRDLTLSGLKAVGDLALSLTDSALGDATLESDGLVALDDITTGAAAITSGDLTATDLTTTDGLTLTGTGDATFTDLAVGGPADLTAASIGITLSDPAGANTNIGGDFSATATGGDVVISDLDAAGTGTLNATGLVQLDDVSFAGTTATAGVEAPTGGTLVGGEITARNSDLGGVDLTAGGDITLDTIAADDVVAEGTNVTVDDLAGDDLTLIGSDTVALNGVTALDLDVTADTITGGGITANDIDLNADEAVSLTALTADRLTIDGTAADVDLEGAIIDETLSINAGTGAIALRQLTVNNTLGEDTPLDLTGGDISLTDPVGETTLVRGDLRADVSGDLVFENVEIMGAADFDAGGDLTASDIEVAGRTDIDAGGTATLENLTANTGLNINQTAGAPVGNVVLNGVSVAGALNVDGMDITSDPASTLQVTGATVLDALGRIGMGSTALDTTDLIAVAVGDLELGDTTTSDGSVFVFSSEGSIGLGDVTSDTTVTLLSKQGDIDVGAVTSPGFLQLSAENGSITAGGAVDAGDNTVIESGGAVLLNKAGTNFAGNLAIFGGGGGVSSDIVSQTAITLGLPFDLDIADGIERSGTAINPTTKTLRTASDDLLDGDRQVSAVGGNLTAGVIGGSWGLTSTDGILVLGVLDGASAGGGNIALTANQGKTTAAGDRKEVRFADLVGGASRLGDVSVTNAENILLGAPLTGGGLLDLDRTRDVFEARNLTVANSTGELKTVRVPDTDTIFETNLAFFGINLTGNLIFVNSGALISIDLTGTLGGTEVRTQDVGLLPVGPRGSNFEFNNCVIGDASDCSNEFPNLDTPIIDLEIPDIFKVDFDDLADVYVTFGNEELWAVPNVFLQDVTIQSGSAQ